MLIIPTALGRTTGHTITPADAKAIIEERNKNNKPILKAKVKKYVDKMRRGKWSSLPEGYTFIFDEDGRCLSAQHRLIAAMEADFTFENATIDIVPREDWLHNTVEKRSDKDQFFMKYGGQYSTDASNCIRKVAGQVPFITAQGQPYVQTSGCTSPRRNDDAVMNRAGDLIEAVVRVAKANKKKLKAQQLTALGCYAFSGLVDQPELLRMALADVESPKNSLVGWVSTYRDYLFNSETDFDRLDKTADMV